MNKISSTNPSFATTCLCQFCGENRPSKVGSFHLYDSCTCAEGQAWYASEAQRIQREEIDIPYRQDLIAIEKARKRATPSASLSTINTTNRFKGKTFDNYVVDKNTEPIVVALKQYTAKFSRQTVSNILMHGKTGTGKTHLASAIASLIQTKGFTVNYIDYTTLVKEFKNFEDKQHAETFLKRVCDSDLLIIDDINSKSTSEWISYKLLEVIDNRYNSKKPIIIISRLTLDGLKRTIGAASYSRLIEDCLSIRFDFTDYRQK